MRSVSEELGEHLPIDQALRNLYQAALEPESGDVVALVQRVLDLFRAHLEVEQRTVAKYSVVQPEDGRRLTEAHEAIAATLDELHAKAQQGTLTADDVLRAKTMVIVHEAHEETGLYRWVTNG